jgi:hypothetical protein
MSQADSKKQNRKRGPRHRSRERKNVSPLSRSVFLADIFKKPAHQALNDHEQRIITKHLVFIKNYRQVLRLKFNANEDLWVNGAKSPDDRGGCQHLFGKIDRQIIESALNRGQLSQNNSQRLSFLEGAAALVQDVQIWVSYLSCLKETQPERLLKTFEETLTWIDFEQMSLSKLKSLLLFMWEGFSGPTRLTLWLQLMGRKAFSSKIAPIIEAEQEAHQDLFTHTRLFHALLSEDPTFRWNDLTIQKTVQEWLDFEKLRSGTLSRNVRLRLWRLLMKQPSIFAMNDWLWASILKDWTEERFLEGIWIMIRRAMHEGEYGRAQKVLKVIPSSQNSGREAQYLLNVLGKPQIGPFALMDTTIAQEDYRGEAFWLPRRVQVFLNVTSMSEGKKFLSQWDAVKDVRGLCRVVSASGFDQGAFCIAYMHQGLSLPRFLNKEKRLEPDNLLALWLEGLHTVRQLTERGIELNQFSANDWYASFQRHAGQLEMVITELNVANASASNENMSYIKMMNQYFIKYCNDQKKLNCLFNEHQMINDNIHTAAEAVVILESSYLKYIGHMSRGFVL